MLYKVAIIKPSLIREKDSKWQ